MILVFNFVPTCPYLVPPLSPPVDPLYKRAVPTSPDLLIKLTRKISKKIIKNDFLFIEICFYKNKLQKIGTGRD